MSDVIDWMLLRMGVRPPIEKQVATAVVVMKPAVVTSSWCPQCGVNMGEAHHPEAHRPSGDRETP